MAKTEYLWEHIEAAKKCIRENGNCSTAKLALTLINTLNCNPDNEREFPTDGKLFIEVEELIIAVQNGQVSVVLQSLENERFADPICNVCRFCAHKDLEDEE